MNKKTFSIILIIGLTTSLFLSGCASEQGDVYKQISPKEANKRFEAENDIILLDVRTIEEYQEKHIPGSTLIPVEVISDQIENKIPDKSTTIFVYCRSGNRSKTATYTLLDLGYTDVYDLGGIISWPYEVESGM